MLAMIHTGSVRDEKRTPRAVTWAPRPRALVAVLLATAAIRLAVFSALPGVFSFETSGVIHGSAAYDAYALGLLDTGVFGREPGVADAAVPPVYSGVLAIAYAIGGRSGLTVAVLHTACDLATVWLLTAIARRLFTHPAIAVIAGLAFAGYPYLVFQTLALNDTALFMLELHLLVWLMMRLGVVGESGRRRMWLAGGAGAVLGLGVLTRPVLGVVAVAVGLWLGTGRRRPPLAIPALLLVTTAALPIAAWTLRNLAVLGHPVTVATNGGSNFWQGNNPQTVPVLRAGYDVQWISPGPLATLDYRDPTAGRHFVAAAMRFLREHPERIPELLWVKLRTHWSLGITPRHNPSGGDELVVPGTAGTGPLEVEAGVAAYSGPLFERVGRRLHRLTWGLALVLAVVGAVSWPRRRRQVALVVAVELALTAFYVVFHPSTRYRLPGDPLVLVLSAAGVVAVAVLLRRLVARSSAHART